jgi:hypothetical protein
VSLPLTTLDHVKTYIADQASTQDTLITALIARESALIEQWTGRIFPVVTTTNKLLDGNGSKFMMLPEAPVLSVSLLQVFATPIAVSPDGIQEGYVFDEYGVYLVPTGFGTFTRGRKNITCSWIAGYEATETGYTSTGNSPTYMPSTGGMAAQSVSVVYAANGVALGQVANTPTVGHYTLSGGNYSFASGDANTQMTFDYYYIPAPVEQACIEMVALDLKERMHIDQTSSALAGETTSYVKPGMTDSVKMLLQPYRKVFTL